MAASDVEGSGTPNDPWVLTTPPGTSEYEAYRDPDADPPALVVQVGATELRYHLHAMLKQNGDWMPLGVADEQKEAKPDTVGVGSISRQPRPRLVWLQEGPARPVRELRATGARGARARRARAQPPQ